MELFITGHSSISALGSTELEIQEHLATEKTAVKSVVSVGLGSCNIAIIPNPSAGVRG